MRNEGRYEKSYNYVIIDGQTYHETSIYDSYYRTKMYVLGILFVFFNIYF